MRSRNYRGTFSAIGLVAASALGVGGCGPLSKTANAPRSGAPLLREGIDSPLNVRAPDRISEAFREVRVGGEPTGGAVVGATASGVADPTPALAPSNQVYLAIQKSALDREFLMQASVIPQNTQQTSSGLQAQVVAFKKRGDKIVLVQATAGLVVTQDLPATILIAEFPVQSETDAEVVIDFNAGMRRVMSADNWYASDSNGRDFSFDPSAFEVAASFIDSIRPHASTLEIRQIAQVRQGLPFGMGTVFPTAEFRYYISPYRPNPRYVAKSTSDFREVGYFEVAPRLEDATGRNLVRASRWDVSQPITYSVSANTPAEYVTAVKEGILYWNHVFGREVLRAEVAPAGVTAPDPQYNIVQWVPNDSAGSAYADGLMDPRTGEILHAQIYMTSVFAVSSRSKAAAAIRRLGGTARANPASRESLEAHTTLGIRGFKTTRLCDFEPTDAFVAGLESALASGADDARILEISKDYVREVVSHEVGHTLGLRHNFAGSLASNVTQDQRDQAFDAYVRRGEEPRVDAVVPSSTTMDYLIFEDSVLTGSQMKRPDFAMAYDKRAIAWGYADAADHRADGPLFCTDGQAEGRAGLGTFYDCMRFDSGSSSLGYQRYVVDSNLKRLPNQIFETYLSAKTNRFADERQTFDQVQLPVTGWVTRIKKALDIQSQWMKAETPRALSVERKFPVIQDWMAQELTTQTSRLIGDQIAAQGSFPEMFGFVLPAESRDPYEPLSGATARLETLLQQDATRAGVGYDGQAYRLTDGEVQAIRTEGSRAIGFLTKRVIEVGVDALKEVKRVPESYEDPAEQHFINVAREVVLKQSDAEIPGTSGKGKEFAYTLNARKSAAKLVTAELSELNGLSVTAAKDRLKTDLKAIIERAVGGPVADVDLTRLSRSARVWFLDQKALLGSL